MFEIITEFLPKLKKDSYGEYGFFEKENNCLTYYDAEYSDTVMEFIDAVYAFLNAHKEMDLVNYKKIISDSEVNPDNLTSEELTILDGRTTMAFIIYAIRKDRFCDGALLTRLRNGSIEKWLKRLKEIDEGNNK